MPLFFFDTVEDEICFTDEVGTDLTDLAAARREATRTAGELIRCSTVDRPVQQFVLTVRDQNRSVVAQCSFGMADLRGSRLW